MPTNADYPGVYTSEKNVNLITIVEIHLRRDIIYGSVLNSLGQPILFRFVLDKSLGYKVFVNLKKYKFQKKTNLFGKLKHFI